MSEEPPCSTRSPWPYVDLALAIAATGGLISPLIDLDQEAVLWGTGVVAFGASSAYGFHHRSRCQDARTEYARLRRERELRRQQALAHHDHLHPEPPPKQATAGSSPQPTPGDSEVGRLSLTDFVAQARVQLDQCGARAGIGGSLVLTLTGSGDGTQLSAVGAASLAFFDCARGVLDNLAPLIPPSTGASISLVPVALPVPDGASVPPPPATAGGKAPLVAEVAGALIRQSPTLVRSAIEPIEASLLACARAGGESGPAELTVAVANGMVTEVRLLGQTGDWSRCARAALAAASLPWGAGPVTVQMTMTPAPDHQSATPP